MQKKFHMICFVKKNEKNCYNFIFYIFDQSKMRKQFSFNFQFLYFLYFYLNIVPVHHRVQPNVHDRVLHTLG